MPRKRGTTIRRGNSWSARVTINGEKVWLGSDFPTEEKAQKAIDATLAGEETQVLEELVKDFAERWVRDFPRPKRSTNMLYAGKARQVVNATDPLRIGKRIVVFPNLRMNQVNRKIARAVVNQHPSLHAVLRAMWNDAIADEDEARANPFANLGIRKSKGRANIVPLTAQEVDLLADLALDVFADPEPRFAWFAPQMRSLILVAAYTGIRPGELFALEVTDVDLTCGEVHIRRRAWRGEIDEPKTGNSNRTRVLPDEAIAALRPVMPPAGRIFSTKTGRIFTQTSWTYYWHKLRAVFEDRLPPERARQLRDARRSKGPLEFYELRHFCATHLRDLGVDPADVGHQLGHSDGTLVEERYGHPSDALTRERIRRALRQNVRDLRSVDEAVGE